LVTCASTLLGGVAKWSLSLSISPRAHGTVGPEYQAMFDAARKRRFDILLVWRYDRFARSMQELVNALEEFRTLGIDFISYRENADTTTAQGKLIFGITASLAEFERALIAERVKAGMARAKALGEHVGRPRIPAQKEAAIRRELLAGRSLQSTIKAHGVGSKTGQRIKAEPAMEAGDLKGHTR
jgi:DNA invertase Pin-like site-specific DNA recombinase